MDEYDGFKTKKAAAMYFFMIQRAHYKYTANSCVVV